jgi:8-oxo-dGTP pyrophosphatase MutT (NUDIX family)
MEPELLKQEEPFRRAVIDKLGPLPIDFAEQRDFIESTKRSAEPYSAAGVILLLFYRESAAASPTGQGEYCFHLIKRSTRVAQPGDLSCPGGMLAPRLDASLKPFIAHGWVPVVQGDARRYTRQRRPDESDALMLFLAGALREAWEEIRLSPFNVQFLGPLPCHSLILFRRTIFPLVGLVKHPPRYRPNREVERIVEIPLSAFFDSNHYARLQVRAVDDIRRSDSASWEFPCFVQQDDAYGREILWGATFHIILRFLEILFDFKLPDVRSHPVIPRTLGQAYMTGTR